MCIRTSLSQFVISVSQTSSRQNLSPEGRLTSRFDLPTLGVSTDILTYSVFSEEDAISVMDEFHKRGVKTVILSRFGQQVDRIYPHPPLLSVRPLLKRVKGFAYTIHKTITKIVNKKVETFL